MNFTLRAQFTFSREMIHTLHLVSVFITVRPRQIPLALSSVSAECACLRGLPPGTSGGDALIPIQVTGIAVSRVFAQLPSGRPPAPIRSPARLHLTRGQSKDSTPGKPFAQHGLHPSCTGPSPQGRERSRPISLVSRRGCASLPCPGGRPAAFPQCLTRWPVSSCLLAVS